jgi:predicted membrane protein
MAEPISIVSGALSVVDRAARLSIFLSGLTSAQKEGRGFDTLNFEINIYTKILKEVSQIALSGTSKLPESATMSLQLCNVHLSEIESKLEHILKASKLLKKMSEQKDLEASVKDYRRSVKMLRAIVME